MLRHLTPGKAWGQVYIVGITSAIPRQRRRVGGFDLTLVDEQGLLKGRDLTWRDAGKKCKLISFPPHRITIGENSLTPEQTYVFRLSGLSGLFGKFDPPLLKDDFNILLRGFQSP